MKKAIKNRGILDLEEERPFVLDGHYLSHDDVTFLAETILFQALCPGTRTKEHVSRKLDQDGTVIEETTEKTTLPPDWRAAEAWLHIQALKKTNC